jgi:hypothetical protein
MLFEETVLAGTKSLLHLQNSAVAGEKPRASRRSGRALGLRIELLALRRSTEVGIAWQHF